MGKSLDAKGGRGRKTLDTSRPYSLPSSSSSDSISLERRRTKRLSRHRDSSRHHSSRRSERRKGADDDKKVRKRRHKPMLQSDHDSICFSSETSLEPEALVRIILDRFPDVASDLDQLLQTIDSGQGIDMKGISNESLVKHLEKLFFSLKLKQNKKGFFLLPPLGVPTLEVIGPILCSHLKSRDDSFPNSSADVEGRGTEVDNAAERIIEAHGKHDSSTSGKRRLIGPAMPSRELLAAAAELTEAETLLREADLEIDNGLLIGPPPPAMVAEAETANEAERFEEVSRVAAAEVDKPYDILGVNWKMSSDNIKKRYWKLSLMVHPDKCSHPQAQEAFVKLNQAFKDLQDPSKRKAIDEKIKLKEEQEEFKAELQALREAAQWRRLQGIHMEGDDELLAVVKEAPKRDEWMTTLPPERKQGMTMHSTSFSRTTKEGRGDTSIWTDNPLDKAEKAKQNYLEAYNKAKELAGIEDEKLGTSSGADLVDKYNSSKRSISLAQKHEEESSQRRKKKLKQPEKEEWVGQHPWKPWDRENDLGAGRKKVNLDSDSMAQGLSSRFSSGAVQRNFL